jgi:hypothetical protein
MVNTADYLNLYLQPVFSFGQESLRFFSLRPMIKESFIFVIHPLIKETCPGLENSQQRRMGLFQDLSG